jgi:ABC-type nitrate/sulfonate/bicarbonate transport system substrate-binding protein
MSALDQPLLIANSNYHVGQQTSIRVAEEQGYFREEGLAEWEYDWRGLLPGPLEKRGLALAMRERGVDVATAVDVGSILHQRLQGADLYVVGGWRYPPNFKLFGAKDVTEPAQLRGRRIGNREVGGLGQYFIANNLRKVGVDAYTEVEWVLDPVFAYGNDPAHLDWLREGRVDALTSQPPFSDVLEAEGFPVLLDPLQIYPGGRPDAASSYSAGRWPSRSGSSSRAASRWRWCGTPPRTTSSSSSRATRG